MTVKELIQELLLLDPNSTVIMAKDAEGNGYSPLYDLRVAHYTPIRTWYGYILEDEYEHYPEPENVPEGTVAAVILGPVN